MDNKRQGRNVFVSTFRVPDEYERSRMEAERRAALAEMLEAQAYQPLNVNQPAPIAPSQGLAKVLKQYMGAYEKRKAREAEEKAKGEELETAAEIQGRLMGVDQLFDRDETGEMQSIYATPEQQQAQIEADIARQRATGQLEEMTPTAQYQRDPMDALRLASTPAGIAATRGNPTLAAMLQKSMETPICIRVLGLFIKANALLAATKYLKKEKSQTMFVIFNWKGLLPSKLTEFLTWQKDRRPIKTRCAQDNKFWITWITNKWFFRLCAT
jgi:hypothetical protein